MPPQAVTFQKDSRTKQKQTMTMLLHTHASVRDPLEESTKLLSLPLCANADCSVVKRSVKFASSPKVVGFVEALDDLTAEQKNSTWWSSAEMKEIIRDAKALSKDAQSSTFIVSAFEKAYQTSSQEMVESESTFEDVVVVQELVDYCRFGHSWRGLERSSSKLYCMARSSIVNKARSVVIEMKNEGADGNVIQQAYARATYPARHFARVIGDADAIVSKERFVRKRKSNAV